MTPLSFKQILHKIHTKYRIFRFNRIPGLKLGNGVIFQGKPIIDIREGAAIIIKEGVSLGSKNSYYHLNMHSPVKLYADRPGATITIGERTRVWGSCIHAYSAITIGKKCLIAANCQIIDGSGHDLSFDDVANRINTTGNSSPIVIEDYVWIGANSIILPGVTIGKGSVIGAGSIVTKDIPAMVVASGNPAKVVRTSGEVKTKKSD